MSYFHKIIVCLGVLVVSACATIEDGAGEPATETVATQAVVSETGSALSPADPDDVICRREQVTGSNFRREVCRTRAQRDSMRRDSREDIEQRRSATLGRN